MASPRVVAAYSGPACPLCDAPLDLGTLVAGPQHCAHCARPFEATRFSPVQRRARVAEVGAGGPQEAASCAAHRRNTAVGSCQRCGIFMCALCRTEVDRMEVCAPCFERLAAEGVLHSAATQYRSYLGLSWIAGIIGAVLWFPGLITGPAAIYCAMRGMQQMREWGDVGGRGRAVAAMALGVVSTIQGGVTVAALVT
jgi:hypothetical protein